MSRHEGRESDCPPHGGYNVAFRFKHGGDKHMCESTQLVPSHFQVDWACEQVAWLINLSPSSAPIVNMSWKWKVADVHWLQAWLEGCLAGMRLRRRPVSQMEGTMSLGLGFDLAPVEANHTPISGCDQGVWGDYWELIFLVSLGWSQLRDQSLKIGLDGCIDFWILPLEKLKRRRDLGPRPTGMREGKVAMCLEVRWSFPSPVHLQMWEWGAETLLAPRTIPFHQVLIGSTR